MLQAHPDNDTSEYGFTVVEMIVAMTLFVLMVATFVSIFTSVQYSQRITGYLDLARNAAVAQMEKVRSEPNEVVNGQYGFSGSLPSGLPENATGTVTVTSSSQVTGMKNIEVKVAFQYPVGGIARSVELNSVLGASGIAE